jgi:hypothetical protein
VSTQDSLAPPSLPILTLRVGVTGHRRLPEIDRFALEDAIVAVLSRVANVATSTVANPGSGYARPDAAAAGAESPPAADADAARLVVVSALAEGADRLVAEVALDLGYHLHAPLPFPAEEYAYDFETEASRAEFARLLARASRVLELDGRPANTATEHDADDYRRVGVVILSNCDVLVALWDGVYTGKSGGTSQVVAEALRVGIPVVWISTIPPHAPVLLQTSYSPERDGSVGKGADAGPGPAAPLTGVVARGLAVLRRILGGTPTRVAEPPGEDALQLATGRTRPLCTLDGVLGRIVAPPKDAAAASSRYFKQPRFWKRGPPLYAWFRGLVLIGRRRGGGDAAEPVPDAPDYAWADHLASLFATFHRSAFVANYVLAALAVVLAVSDWAALGHWAIWVELASILAIVVITRAGRRGGWHEQWLQYRLLAEHFRQADLLVPLGRTSAAARPRLSLPGTRAEERWITWLFRARVREAGLQCGRLTPDILSAYRERLLEVIRGQHRYHLQNAREQRRLHRRLHRVGSWLFKTTLVACILHLLAEPLLKWMHHGKWELRAGLVLTAVAAAFPALGAAAAAISGQAEYVRTQRRSERMAERLGAMERKIPPNAGSDQLALLAEEATELMSSELQDWHVTFRVRPLELPA